MLGCLPSTHGALVWLTSNIKIGHDDDTCNPSLWEVALGRLEVQDHLWIFNEVEANLQYTGPWHKANIKYKRLKVNNRNPRHLGRKLNRKHNSSFGKVGWWRKEVGWWREGRSKPGMAAMQACNPECLGG